MAKQVFVVLGMHKSGTTLIAKILHRSGIEMDDEAGPPVTTTAASSTSEGSSRR